jgi:nickel-dependent lactate racemase
VIARLARGRGDLRLDLRGLRVRPLDPDAPATCAPVAETVAAAVDQPLCGPPLSQGARGCRNAVIVVPDATRRVDLPEVLPVLFARLRSAGVPDDAVTIVVACGTHPAVEQRQLEELVGPVPPAVVVMQHDARAQDEMVALHHGTDSVWRGRTVAEASFVVTVSSVRHHYFAGFGGGPKMLFPGVGAYGQIQSNHARVMCRDGQRWRRHPGCEPGVLAGNPVAEEIARLAAVRPPDGVLCTVPARDGHVGWAAYGGQTETFAAAVDVARSWYEIPREGPFDLMVVSAGGHPGDGTLIQAHKALDAASRFLAPGGEMLFVAELGGGGGSPDIEPFLERPDADAILDRLAERWVQYGHTVLRIVEKTARSRIWLHSELDPTVAQRLGFVVADDPADVVGCWRRDRPGQTVAVMNGPPVYPSSDAGSN